MRGRVWVLAALVVLLAACDSPTATVDAPATPLGAPSTLAPSGAATLPGASAAPVDDCGTFTLRQGDDLPTGVVTCLIDAVRAKQVTRLRVTSPTTEGDPIPVTYTSGPDGTVEVITDSRQDGFGTQTVVRKICTGPSNSRGRIVFARCSVSTTVAD